jgi:glutamyl-tRNA synthetase
VAELEKLNQLLLHKMPFEEAQKRFGSSLPNFSQKFWDVIRGNVDHPGDVDDWHHRVFLGTFTKPEGPLEENLSSQVLTWALDTFPQGEGSLWDEATWGQWTQAIASATGLKGKSIFLPLRLALTGLPHGPEMRLLLPFIGPEEAMKRLKAAMDRG